MGAHAACCLTCPATGDSVEVDSREATLVPDHYIAVECDACGLIHFVMPETGEVMGSPDE